MPAFDEAFANMFRAAGEAQQRGADIADRKRRAAWEQEDRAYRDSERKRVGDARSALENAISGMDASSQRDIGAAGYTPDQISTGIAAQGGAKQFAEQVARYQNDFDSSDLADSGAAARAAQGLPIKGPGVSPATVKAPRKSELAGARARYALAMGQDPGAALADQDKAQSEERMKDWFSQFSHLSPKGLLEHPMLAGMLNGNSAVRGAVGLAKDGKTFIVADYNGSGTAEEFTRDELMQAAYQKFLESEGRVPESIALGLGRTDRKRARNREDVQDANKGQELAYGMNIGNKRFDLSEREFYANQNYRDRALSLQGQELGLRRDALNLQHPTLSKEDRDALSKIYEAHAAATDPVARAALERQHNMIVQRAALGMGRVPGLLGSGARPPAEYKAADAIKLAEMLSADPANKGKSQQELFEMARQTLSNQGSGGWENPYGQPGPQQPAAAKPAQPAQPARSLFNGAPTQQPAAPGPGSWLYRGGSAPQVVPQGRGDSLIEMYQAREAALPPGVTTSGLGYMVNGRAYFSRDDALRAAGY